MIHPKSENVLKVIRNFESVLQRATRNDHLDMAVAYVNNDHECGTVHCHGGWYAVAACNLKQTVGFTDGANKMAEHLGFKRNEDLENWAKNNPEIWGNDDGYAMFCMHSAFCSPSRLNGAESLKDIIDHWNEVYERLVTIEGKELNFKEVIRYVAVPETITEQATKLILS